MKLLRKIALGTAILAVSTTSSFAKTELRLSDVLPDTNFMVENARTFADAVAKETGGEVTITVSPAGSLGFKGPDQLAAVRDGLVDMADINISQQVGSNPMFGAEGVPFLVSSMDELKEYHKSLRPEFEKLFERYNQKLLYMVPSPAQYLYLKVKVDDIEGFKGIPVRGADKNTVDIVSSIGMNGVVMPWGELLPALASGRVDGVATSATSGVDGRFWEFLEYVYPTNHTWGSNAVTINLDTWNSISEENRKKIEEVAASLEPGFWDVSRQADEKSIAIMGEHNMTLVPLSDKLKSEIAEKAKTVQAEFFERVPDAKPFADAFLAAKNAK